MLCLQCLHHVWISKDYLNYLGEPVVFRPKRWNCLPNCWHQNFAIIIVTRSIEPMGIFFRKSWWPVWAQGYSKPWLKLELVWSKPSQRVVKNSPTAIQGSDDRMMSFEDPGVRLFWKLSCKYSRFRYFFLVRSAKSFWLRSLASDYK